MCVEILAPAGDRKCFSAAVNAGANAIYLGLNEFSARKSAENFSVDNLAEYLNLAHFFGIKVYIAVNTLVKDSELNSFLEIISKAYRLGADAFIMQDMLLGKVIKEAFPDICLHLSTQAGVCNEMGALLAAEHGFSRVILARETAFEDIKKISKIIETEVFVQGALCTSFSGHCYMSSFAGGLSGNRGFCKQPCRKYYTYSGGGIKPFGGYDLSLADLCLKDHLSEYIEAGVKSFKIEGRMRSPEYVYSAVSVYRLATEGKNNNEEFSHLKRSFNRGDYTTGYFKPFTRGIISSKIQGNIGDFIGNVISVSRGICKVKTDEELCEKDGFKVIRNGLEAGSAVYVGRNGNCACFKFFGDVSAGDGVFITKDSAYSDFVEKSKRLKKINVELSFIAGSTAKAEISSDDKRIFVASDEKFESADKRPLTESEVVDCFLKVDDFPFDARISVLRLDNVFAPKSKLNAFRRKCYSAFFAAYNVRVDVTENTFSIPLPVITPDIKSGKITVISNDFSFDTKSVDTFVFKPFDYRSQEEFERFFSQAAGKENFLYVPPYASGSDMDIIKIASNGFDGLYAEGYFGMALAKELGLKLFAGTGFNLFNSLDIRAAEEFSDKYAYSKELSLKEIRDAGGKGYVFSLGCIQVMDLIYCPFSFDCKNCRRGNVFSLTDESGRSFTVRRYKLSACRFEVYNPYALAGSFSGNKLYDFTLFDREKCNSLLNVSCEDDIKNILGGYTSGSLIRGIK